MGHSRGNDQKLAIRPMSTEGVSIETIYTRNTIDGSLAAYDDCAGGCEPDCAGA
jgi:hypothetical protein